VIKLKKIEINIKENVIYVLIYILMLVFTFFTKFIFPFYSILIPQLRDNFNREPLGYQIIIINLLFLVLISILSSITIEKNKLSEKKLIITFFLIFAFTSLLGIFSQNSLYASDDFLWLGYVKYYKNNFFDFSFNFSYSYNLYPRILALVSIITRINETFIFMYFTPILLTIMKYPFFEKALKSNNTDVKRFYTGLIVVINPFWPRSYSAYSFLLSIFYLFLSTFPLNTKKRILIGGFLCLIALLTHIHGFFFIFFYMIMLLLSSKTKFHKKVYIIALSSIFTPIALILLKYFGELFPFNNISFLNLGKFYRIVIEKLTYGNPGLLGVYISSRYSLSLFYDLSLFIFIIIISIGSLYSVISELRTSKNRLKVKFCDINLLNMFLVCIYLAPLFVGNSTLLTRFYRFIMAIGLFYFIDLYEKIYLKFVILVNFQNIKTKFRIFRHLCILKRNQMQFVLLVFILIIANFIAYVKYIPLSEDERIASDYLLNHNFYNGTNVFLVESRFGKLMYSESFYANISILVSNMEISSSFYYPLRKTIPFITWENFWLNFGMFNISKLNETIDFYEITHIIWTQKGNQIGNIEILNVLCELVNINTLHMIFNEKYVKIFEVI